MCGRFTLRQPPSVMIDQLQLQFPEIAPRYNIAPLQTVPVVRQSAKRGKYEVAPMRWGLVPSWADDPKIGNRMINARSETAATKPSFRSAMKKRRCLIPTDGYYEWQATDGAKQPYLFHLADEQDFALAGLWEHWAPEGQPPLETFTILTTEANRQTAKYHDRMPVILAPDDWTAWLDPEFADAKHLQSLLRPTDTKLMIDPASRRTNNPRHDAPDCLNPDD